MLGFMQNPSTQAIAAKFAILSPLLDERARRLWAAAEARAIGRGGISQVAEATGLSRATIRAGIVKLFKIILSPGNRRYFPDAIATDPPFRRPALSPLFPPNSRTAAASLCGTPARTADAVWGESVGQWGHTRTRIAGHALLT